MVPRWPNTFIVGAGKAGTTSLYRYLAQHPDVFVCEPKEPHFFTRTWELEADDLDAARQAYMARFEQGSRAKVRLEASPSYLFHPPVPERIHQAVPDARILVMVRDPVARAYSHFLFHERTRAHLSDLREAVLRDEGLLHLTPPEDRLEAYFHGELYLFVEMGRYAEQIQRYLDVFGEEQVHVVVLERLKTQATKELGEVAKFLGLDPDPLTTVEAKPHNPYRGPPNRFAKFLQTDPRVKALARTLFPTKVRSWVGNNVLIRPGDKPKMDPAARELLATAYEPVVNDLEAVLGEALPELRASWPGPRTEEV